jgi:hypothetical protein
MAFFEVLWHGDAIGDGGDLEEALLAYASVRPDDGDWATACAAGADPQVLRYASFDAFLDNDDALEAIAVTAAMITAALADVAPAPSPEANGGGADQ